MSMVKRLDLYLGITRFMLLSCVLILCSGVSQRAVADEKSDIAELKELVEQMQERFNNAVVEHERQMKVLQDRIDELESQNAETVADQAALEDKVLEQETASGILRSTLIDQVRWSGYYDFEYVNADNEEVGSFRQHHLSLFLTSSSEDERWKFFSEIEFEDAPDFSFNDQSGSGSINIENAWIEFRHNDALRLRGGKLLLPQYWQTYHYPNLTLSTMRPLMVGAVFPKGIVGIAALGDYWFDNGRGLSYTVYAGNGPERAYSSVDANDNKSVGGRVTMHLAKGQRFEKLDISASGYGGRDEFDNTEHVFGLDTQMQIGDFELLAEYALGSQHSLLFSRFPWRTRAREESKTEGFYAQLGYQFMPAWRAFYRYDWLDLVDHKPGPYDMQKHTLGVNYRPNPSTSLKLEGFEAIPEGGFEPYLGFAASIVFNF